MTDPSWHFILETPLGPLGAQADDSGRLQRLSFLPRREITLDAMAGLRPHPAFRFLQRQMDDYFQGHCRTFNVPLAPEGTPFQLLVWRHLLDVPYAETLSYAELAARIGGPTHTRAVAQAVGQNPVAILVPCHRIVGSDGSLTGYAAGLDRKRALLAIEHGEQILGGLLAEA